MFALFLIALLSSFTVVDSFNETAFRKIFAEEYNFFREIHDVEPLKHDRKLQRSASLWAEYLGTAPGKMCIHHSLYGGENIYFYYSFKNITPTELAQKAVRAFYEEIKFYDFRNPGMVWPAAHFTQMTWKSAERMGVGVYSDIVLPGETHGGCNIRSTEQFPARFYFVVVQQWPHGNIMTSHHFARNVLRPKKIPKDMDFEWSGNVTGLVEIESSSTLQTITSSTAKIAKMKRDDSP